MAEQVLTYLETWNDEVITSEVFNQRIDNFVSTLSVDQVNYEAFSNAISILKKSYEYHYADMLELPSEKDNPGEENEM